jgi:hypothetical protein
MIASGTPLTLNGRSNTRRAQVRIGPGLRWRVRWIAGRIQHTVFLR